MSFLIFIDSGVAMTLPPLAHRSLMWIYLINNKDKVKVESSKSRRTPKKIDIAKLRKVAAVSEFLPPKLLKNKCHLYEIIIQTRFSSFIRIIQANHHHLPSKNLQLHMNSHLPWHRSCRQPGRKTSSTPRWQADRHRASLRWWCLRC